MATVLATSSGGHVLFVLLVLLHAATALVGFGSIGFAGTYATRAARMAAAPEWWSGLAPAQQVDRMAGGFAQGGPAAPAAVDPAGRPEEGGAEDPRVETGHHGVEQGLVAGDRAGGGRGAEEPLEHDPEGPLEHDPEVEELIRYFRRPARFWPAVVAVPVFGLLALWAQPDGKGLNQVWSVAALLVWAVALVVVAGIVLPGLRQMTTMLTSSDPEALDGSPATSSTPGGAASPTVVAWRARLGRAGALAGRGAAACDVLFFVALALMIWQP